MKVEEALEQTRRVVQRTKELAQENGVIDIPAMAVGFQGDKLTLIVGTPAVNAGIDVADIACAVARICGPDLIGLAFEGYESLTEDDINPLTGRGWDVGEMQAAAQHHDGLEQGWLREGVEVLVVNRAGDWGYLALPYRRAGQTISWIDAEKPAFSLTGDEVTSAVLEAALRAMALPTVVAAFTTAHPDLAAALGSDLTPEATLAHQECAAAGLLEQVTGYDIIMLAEPGSTRDLVIRAAVAAGLLTPTVLTPVTGVNLPG